MTRLFLSLYVFIVITLVVLSALLNHLFFSDDTSYADNVVSTQIIGLADMAWSEADLTLLSEGKTLRLYDPQKGNQMYRLINHNQLVEITLNKEPENDNQYILYSGIFFVALGILIALWTWPLWRDLQRLKQATKTIDRQGNIEPINIESRSLVYPIALAIQDLGKRISELLNTQRELTSDVAHEFRTPLARLKFALAAQPESNVIDWHELNQDVDELEKLIQEMLSYTSMESQVPELNITEIPIQLLCAQRIKQVDCIVSDELTMTVVGEQANVLADEHFAARTIDNLLLNACRYAKLEVRVNVHVTSEFVIVSVEDDGVGVAPEFYERVFQPFFRPDTHRDRKHGGAGLGLAIVKRIMLWHGGDCTVDKSELGGASFNLYFAKRDHLPR